MDKKKRMSRELIGDFHGLDKVPINQLEYLAYKMSSQLIPEDDIIKIDRTQVFFDSLEDMINHKELINITVLGFGARGKSTIACFVLWYVNKLLGIEVDETYIDSDQIDFIRSVKDPTLCNQMRLIDEWNQMGQTGLNATTEDSLFKSFSEVQTQRWIHRIGCSPSKYIDPNSTITLTVLNKHFESRVTRAFITVSIYRNNVKVDQMLGYVDFPVFKIMELDWYKSYEKKKREKWEMFTKENIRDVRAIEHAEIVLKTYNKIKYLAEFTDFSKDQIGVFINATKKELNVFTSILTDEDLKNNVRSLFKAKRSCIIIRNKIKTMEVQLHKEVSDNQKNIIKHKLQNFKRAEGEFINALISELDHFEDILKLKEKYL